MTSTNFDEFSQDYKSLLDRSVVCSGESSEYFAEYKALYLARQVGHDFRGKVLDYGCGVGLLSSFLKKHLPNATFHGYDPSSESVRVANQELGPSGFFASDIEQLQRDYQLVVISNVMHHVPPPDRQDTIAKVTQRMAVSGKLVIFEHNPMNPLTQYVVKHCPFDGDAVLLMPGEARKYVKRAGLCVLRLDYVVFFPRILGPLRRFEPLLAWFPLGAQYALVAALHSEKKHG